MVALLGANGDSLCVFINLQSGQAVCGFGGVPGGDECVSIGVQLLKSWSQWDCKKMNYRNYEFVEHEVEFIYYKK